MSIQLENIPESKPTYGEKDALIKPYREPQLQELGDLRTLTLGGSQGESFDSGAGMWSYP